MALSRRLVDRALFLHSGLAKPSAHCVKFPFKDSSRNVRLDAPDSLCRGAEFLPPLLRHESGTLRLLVMRRARKTRWCTVLLPLRGRVPRTLMDSSTTPAPRPKLIVRERMPADLVRQHGPWPIRSGPIASGMFLWPIPPSGGYFELDALCPICCPAATFREIPETPSPLVGTRGPCAERPLGQRAPFPLSALDHWGVHQRITPVKRTLSPCTKRLSECNSPRNPTFSGIHLRAPICPPTGSTPARVESCHQ